MALDEVSAHTGGGEDSALEIYMRGLLEGGERAAPEGFGGEGDGEGGGSGIGRGERDYGQTDAIDGDAVAEVGVREQGGAVGDCEVDTARGQVIDR